MPLYLHFPDDGWERIRPDWCAGWAGELPRSLVVIESIEPKNDSTPHYASTFLSNYGSEVGVDELLDLFVPRLEATYYLGDAFPRFWPNFGPGIVAAFAGAHLDATPDTTWFMPGENTPIGGVKIRMSADNLWWQRVEAITRAAVARWGGQLSIGITDLGGNLDILAHLRGSQQLLLDLVDYPREVDRLVWETHQLWMQTCKALHGITRLSRGITCWGPCWSPDSGYLLQSDFSYMISPHMFERFVLPDLAACCEDLDYPFYHLDGKGQLGHLDMLLSLGKLKGIQWVPGDGQPQAEHWLSLIQRIRRSGKLCQVYVSAQGALDILHELSGEGLLLVINETLAPEDGQALLREISVLERIN